MYESNLEGWENDTLENDDVDVGNEAAVYQIELPCKCGLTPSGEAFCPRLYA